MDLLLVLSSICRSFRWPAQSSTFLTGMTRALQDRILNPFPYPCDSCTFPMCRHALAVGTSVVSLPVLPRTDQMAMFLLLWLKARAESQTHSAITTFNLPYLCSYLSVRTLLPLLQFWLLICSTSRCLPQPVREGVGRALTYSPGFVGGDVTPHQPPLLTAELAAFLPPFIKTILHSRNTNTLRIPRKSRDKESIHKSRAKS